ncbi:MAG: DUF5009 domain-containing protein [Bacteroidaceae bacterium]|nr:DUF5009 domain-containing protein [Bacteroidaceae bacterium]
MKRNNAIDIIRALTMVLMVTVNEFWSVDGIPHWMHHAEATEDMMGLSDIVFPLFIFVMGMSIPYAIDSKLEKSSVRDVVAHILSRSIALLVMGAFICNAEYGISEASGYNGAFYNIMMVAGFFLIWNRYPKEISPWLGKGLKALGIAVLCFLMITSRNGEGGTFSAHWWGILGLIGWTYLVCAMIYFLFCDSKGVLVSFLIAFVVINIMLNKMNPAHNGQVLLTVGGTDFLRSVLDILHMDNCGLCALGMGGVVTAVFTRPFVGKTGKKEALVLVGTSLALFAAFMIAHEFYIISKIIATPSWILAIMSLAVLLYLSMSLLCEKQWDGWFKVIRPAGTATLTCYMMPYLLYGIIGITGFEYPDFLLHFPIGLGKCLAFAFICVALTYLLGKGKIMLKI